MLRALVVTTALLLPSLVAIRAAGATTFGSGTLIIPMDTDAQDNAMLRAYGLVYALVRGGVPVRWAIASGKQANGADFSTNMGTLATDLRTQATVSSPRAYRGGPFLVDAADAGSALPVIAAWQAAPGDATTVHQVVAGSFDADVARTLTRAPRIAVLKDGNEATAFNDLNAAGILDGAGAAWNAGSPDLLTETDVEGATTTADDDGALFHAGSAATRYCHLLSLHYNATSHTDEVVQEVRTWLAAESRTSLYAQCVSAQVFENATGGKFLSYYGIADDGVAPSSVTNRTPTDPVAQIDGAFEVDSGALDSIGFLTGPDPVAKPGVTTVLNESSTALTSRIVAMTGRLDGDGQSGRVTYVGGHDYALDYPVSTSPQTNGVRLLLNALLAADCALDSGRPDPTVSLSAPAVTSGNEITTTIDVANPGTVPAELVRVTYAIPAGATFVSATGGGSEANGVVTWTIGSLAGSGLASRSVTVSVSADGTYIGTATLAAATNVVRSITATPATTIREAATPTATATVEVTATPTATATVAVTATPTVTVAVTATQTPTATPTVSATATATASPSPAPTDPTPTSTPTPTSACAAGPFVCKPAGATSFALKNVAKNASDRLAFTWTKGAATTLSELGQPTNDTTYSLCVWDHVGGTPTLVMEMTVPPGGVCKKKPCWKAARGGKGFSFKGAEPLPGGVQSIRLKPGIQGKASLAVHASGVDLPDPPMPFQQNPQITVQLVSSVGGCWGADYTTLARTNTATALKVSVKP